MENIEKFTKKETFYDILGCGETATKQQICTEFRIKAKSVHPDKNPGSSENNDLYSRLQEAYTVLSDEKQRKDYDLWLNSKLCISYKDWKNAQGCRHLSMHWGARKKTPALESCLEEEEKRDKEKNSLEGVIDSPSSTSEESNTVKELVVGKPTLKRPLFSSSGISKFRKYKI